MAAQFLSINKVKATVRRHINFAEFLKVLATAKIQTRWFRMINGGNLFENPFLQHSYAFNQVRSERENLYE